MADDVLRQLEQHGMLLETERGVVLKDRPKMVVRKKDGSFLYSTTDLCAIDYRINDCGVDRLLYVVDSAQSLHFEGIFDTARKAGMMRDGAEAVHVKLGLGMGWRERMEGRGREGETNKSSFG
eukprot:TRINITY_DN6600_c0_g1_i2.p2 TRINITY_DN6600_c0_g1~~TRINITY_DN6600_c0_g1_i2.p2  ORF type:complete len:123 (-),score=14.22 TRINITY_DN6600_c0_g1_i2:224-592(-)